MLVLDTDHLAEYQRGTSSEARRLKERLEVAAETYATTIITVEEITRLALMMRSGVRRCGWAMKDSMVSEVRSV